MQQIESEGFERNPIISSTSLHKSLDSTWEGIVITDVNGSILYHNQSAAFLFGDGSGRLQKDTWLKFFQLYDLNQEVPMPQEKMPIFRAIAGETFQDCRIYVKNTQVENGFFISCNGAPVLEGEKTVGAILTIRDITETLMREIRMEEERAFYEKLLDFMPAMIYAKDIGGRYIFANKYFCDLFKVESLVGKRMEDIISEEDAKRIRKLEKEIIEGKSEVEFREDVVFPDGKDHHLHSLRFPVMGDDQEVAFIAGITLDETEEVETRIKSINASKLAAIGTMVVEMGHEINNPLSVIKSTTQMIKLMIASEEPKELIGDRLQVIDATVDRIHEIIISLSNLSRDSSKENVTICRFLDIINDIYSLSITKFRMKDILFDVDFDDPLLLKETRCARVQLSEVLLNLIVNGMDAVEGTQGAWVRLELKEDDGGVYFIDSDSGSGVPLEIQDKIFEPFFTTKELGKGTGLGLSISRNIMRGQGGDLYLDYECGPSCFVARMVYK